MPDWAEILRDLDRLQEVDVAQDGKLFQALGVALPPSIRDAGPDAIAESPQTVVLGAVACAANA